MRASLHFATSRYNEANMACIVPYTALVEVDGDGAHINSRELVVFMEN